MEELLRSALPGVDEQTIANLDTKLDELGVISVEDLQYVEEKQINTILKPIQLKKFLQFCHQTLPSSSIMTLDPNSLTSIPTSDENSQEIFNDTNSAASFTTTELSLSSWAHNFEIDWNLFPKEIKEAHDKNTLPLKKHINEMIRILVTQLSNSKKSLGRKEFRIIANKIVGKYPNLFLDKCGDKLIGDGCETLIKKLESCLDNRNRKSIALETNFGTVNKRKTTRDSYGCINWQPSELPEGETKELQMRHKEYLILEFPKSKRQEEEVEYKMKITYSSQRYFINNLKKSIASVKENWPFLVEEKYLLLHANILLEINLKELFSAAVPEKGKKIFDFMQTKNAKTIRNCLNSIAEAKISVQNKVPEVIGAIPLVMAYFNEEQALLFKEVKFYF